MGRRVRDAREHRGMARRTLSQSAGVSQGRGDLGADLDVTVADERRDQRRGARGVDLGQ